MSTHQRSRIAVVGAGAIGSAFASRLAHQGRNEVTVVARPESARLAQLQRDGGVVDQRGERTAVQVAETLDAQTPWDLVIVTVLAHQVDAVMPALQASRARCIQFMFNNFNPERLRAAVGSERCAFGMPFVQASLDVSGRLSVTVGAAGQKSLMDRQASVDLFVAAGLPAALEPHMARWLRCHVPLCVAFESVSVAGVRRGGGATWAEARRAAQGVHACFALLTQAGERLYPASKARLGRSPVWVITGVLCALSHIKSFRTVLATGQSECHALVDTLLAAATPQLRPEQVAQIAAMRPD